MVNFGQLTAEIGWRVWGTHPSKFQLVSRLGFVTAVTSLNAGQAKLCTMYGRLMGWYIIHTLWGLLPSNGILLGAKVTFCSSLASSYIGIVTTRHSSSGCQPNFAAWYLHATGRPSRLTLGGRTACLVRIICYRQAKPWQRTQNRSKLHCNR